MATSIMEPSCWSWPSIFNETVKTVAPLASLLVTAAIAWIVHRVGESRRRQDVAFKIYDLWNTNDLIAGRTELISSLKQRLSWQRLADQQKTPSFIKVMTLMSDAVRLIEPTPALNATLLRKLVPEMHAIAEEIRSSGVDWLLHPDNDRFRPALRICVLLFQHSERRRNFFGFRAFWRLEPKMDNFDSVFYYGRYVDVRKSSMFALDHYMIYGNIELRDPSPTFSTSGYLRAHHDVAQSGISALVHFNEFGKREGRPRPRPAP